MHLEESEIDCTQDPEITKCVTILSDLTWDLRILNQLINDINCLGLEHAKNLQQIYTKRKHFMLLSYVLSLKICCGNLEFSQPELTTGKKCMVLATMCSVLQ